jgi:alpha-glucosidase
MKGIVSRYTELTGRMPLPPLWALGNQQSRWSYYPDSLVEQVARAYREHDLPLDVLYLDIHYMDGYRVFTWDPARFPDPSALTGKLRLMGVKLVTIIDPGVKYQPAGSPGYAVFDEGLAKGYFLRRSNGSLYVGEVWPGKAVFVDYTRQDARRWWGDLHRALLDRGVAGIWNDMNEPSDFVDKSGETQKDVVFDDLGARSLYPKNRNIFALNMDRATFEGLQRLQPDRRPFVITRSGYAGVQRYATMWTGDNNATFDSLALNLPMFESLGLSGEAFVGADLPGFIGRGDGELLARSYEVGFLTPLCRNHAEIDGYDHEPWRYGAPYEDIVRKFLKLRYRLLPFLYTTLEEAHRTGVPLLRPLLLNYQDDPNTLNLDDEFMVGDALLAAPVVRRGERSRDVYLPRSVFYDFWTGERVQGQGALVRADAPLDTVPLYVRGGSVIPTTQAMSHVGEKPWDPVRFDIFPDSGAAASGSLYEDDGISPAYESGAFRRTTVAYKGDSGTISVTIEGNASGYSPGSRMMELALRSGAAPGVVLLDGRPLPSIEPSARSAGWFREGGTVTVVRIGDDGRAHDIRLR